jgi:hypothetical protein
LIWVILGDIVFIGIAYLGSYRLIQSLKDKPAIYFWRHIDARIWCNFFISLKREENRHKEIDKEIIRKIILAFSLKDFF